MKLHAASAVLLAMLWSGSAHATVLGLINTGTDQSGAPLPVGSVQPGWLITAVSPPNPPQGLTPPALPSNAYVVDPYPSWMENSSGLGTGSSWISYTYPLYAGGDSMREFTYSLRFTVDSDVQFLFRVAADNSVRAYLDDPASQALFQWGPFDPPSDVPYQSWSTWVPVSGLSAGEHNLHFVVNNLAQDFGNPTGLRVEFSSVPKTKVPESSVAFFWEGALIVLLSARVLGDRRRANLLTSAGA